MIILNLVGGLGNQLFQLAAAMSLLEKNERLIIKYGLGRTRLLANGKPEIDEYELPQQATFSNQESWLSEFVSKCIGFNLRRQNQYKETFFYKYQNFFIKALTYLVLIIYYRRWIKLVAPTDLGYSKIHKSKNVFLSGYFQSNYWSDLIPNKIINLKCESPQLGKFKRLAVQEQPIVVHIRRGDYKKEDTFGLLSAEYYRLGIEFIMSTTKLRNIWLFSDEPELAKELLTSISHMNVREITETHLSSAELLEIMSLGKAFVIANSTFSWWAAYKSKSDYVVAPLQWFKAAKAPSRLFPDHWHLTSSHFE